MARKYFTATVYKDQFGVYPSGKLVITLPCNHQVMGGPMGMNTEGLIIPLPTSSVPVTEDGTEYQHQQGAIIPEGSIFPASDSFPTNMVSVTEIKDPETGRNYFVGTSSYTTAVETCNDCCTSTCEAPVPEVDGTPGTTTADITWEAVDGVAGYEWVNVEEDGDCENPSTDGTFTTDTEVSLTGLSVDTTYCFAVRSICGEEKFSDWAFVQFTTAA